MGRGRIVLLVRVVLRHSNSRARAHISTQTHTHFCKLTYIFVEASRKDDMRLLCRDLCAEPGHLDIHRWIAFEEYVKTSSPFSILAALEETAEWEWYQSISRESPEGELLEPIESLEPMEPLESMEPLELLESMEPRSLLAENVVVVKAPQEIQERRLGLEATTIRGAQHGHVKVARPDARSLL